MLEHHVNAIAGDGDRRVRRAKIVYLLEPAAIVGTAELRHRTGTLDVLSAEPPGSKDLAGSCRCWLGVDTKYSVM
jgi:hypothetical protein